MHRLSLFLGGILILSIINLDWATKHHRDRGGHKHEQESSLDKQEREREKKERKKDENKKEENRNITCYKCDGDQCRDPFKADDSISLIQCEQNCWKGVFAASVRRSCGNSRCAFSFQGGSAISNTCCQTPLCNNAQIKIPSIIILFYSLTIAFIRIE